VGGRKSLGTTELIVMTVVGDWLAPLPRNGNASVWVEDLVPSLLSGMSEGVRGKVGNTVAAKIGIEGRELLNVRGKDSNVSNKSMERREKRRVKSLQVKRNVSLRGPLIVLVKNDRRQTAPLQEGKYSQRKSRVTKKKKLG